MVSRMASQVKMWNFNCGSVKLVVNDLVERVHPIGNILGTLFSCAQLADPIILWKRNSCNPTNVYFTPQCGVCEDQGQHLLVHYMQLIIKSCVAHMRRPEKTSQLITVWISLCYRFSVPIAAELGTEGIYYLKSGPCQYSARALCVLNESKSTFSLTARSRRLLERYMTSLLFRHHPYNKVHAPSIHLRRGNPNMRIHDYSSLALHQMLKSIISYP